ncbi:photosystem I assembly protein Ycf3 [Gimesia panareensis]|uniref:Photosystem I assembly protein Ycf3 n=1 Tax=Gimesia panareensis TaxID=2527978 RepID=A0A518FKV3_9PLAN|nr:tetratricopeptide repeat protein [Gimesia panareensis]QDV16988.1 photosystem I assembly protein Ycf3 [Gimesia panareensis]
MNNKGLFCSTLILCTLAFHGCTQLNTQVSKVKSALPGKHHEKEENVLAAARSLERQNEWIGAREKYETYLKKNPHSVKACHRLGIVCSHLGDTVAATRYFTEAKQLDPNNSEVLNDFGYALYRRGQYEAAEKILASALQNDAKNTRIMNNLALVVGHQGRFKESYTMFRNIMPEAEAHANVAYIHTQRGEGELALKEYDLALTADPDLKSAGQGAAELALLRNRMLARKTAEAEEQLAAASKEEQKQSQASPKSPTQKQPAQLVSLKASANTRTQQLESLTQQKPAVKKEKLISQVSLKKEMKSTAPVKVNPFRNIPDDPAPATTTTRKIPQPAPQQKPVIEQKPEEAPLEINSFRELDEIAEEKPVIIRISNQVPAAVEKEETLFRSPQELSNQ